MKEYQTFVANENREQFAVHTLDNVVTTTHAFDSDTSHNGQATTVANRTSSITFVITPTHLEDGLSNESREDVDLVRSDLTGDGSVFASTFIGGSVLQSRGYEEGQPKMTCRQLSDYCFHQQLAMLITNIVELHACAPDADNPDKYIEVQSYFQNHAAENVASFFSKFQQKQKVLIIPTIGPETRKHVANYTPNEILHRRHEKVHTTLWPHSEVDSGLAELSDKMFTYLRSTNIKDLVIVDGYSKFLLEKLKEHCLRGSASNDPEVRAFCLRLGYKLSNIIIMMAALHARGTNITKSLRCDDYVGGEAERFLNEIKNIKATDVNKNIGQSTQFARKTATALVKAAMIDLAERGKLKFGNVTTTTGTGAKKRYTFNVDKVVVMVMEWFEANSNESFAIHGLLRLRNHCRSLVVEHAARYGDSEVFECVLVRELCSLGMNFITGMYTNITISMMQQVVQHSEKNVFRMRNYGFVLPSPFSPSVPTSKKSLVEIDDVIEMFNKWIKTLSKQGLGIKMLTDMSTVMPWIQEKKKRLAEGLKVNKKDTHQKDKHKVKHLLDLVKSACNLLRAGLAGLGRSDLELLFVQNGNFKRLVGEPDLLQLERSHVCITPTPTSSILTSSSSSSSSAGKTYDAVVLRIALAPPLVPFGRLSTEEIKAACAFFEVDKKNVKQLKEKYEAYYTDLRDRALIRRRRNGREEWVNLDTVEVNVAKQDQRCTRSLCLCTPEDPLEDFMGSFYHKGCLKCKCPPYGCGKALDVLQLEGNTLEEGMDGLTCSQCIKNNVTHEAARGMWVGRDGIGRSYRRKNKTIGRGQLTKKERKKLRILNQHRFLSNVNADKIILQLSLAKAIRKRKEKVVAKANEMRDAEEVSAVVVGLVNKTIAAAGQDVAVDSSWSDIVHTFRSKLQKAKVITTRQSRIHLGNTERNQRQTKKKK